MSYLARIDRKLNALVKQKSEEEAEQEPTEEEKDEERLREIEERIADLVDLLSEGVTRESADAKVGEHRERVKSCKGEPRPLLRVYHDHGGKRIATTRRTQASCSETCVVLAEIVTFLCVWLGYAYAVDGVLGHVFLSLVLSHAVLMAVACLGLHLVLKLACSVFLM